MSQDKTAAASVRGIPVPVSLEVSVGAMIVDEARTAPGDVSVSVTVAREAEHPSVARLQDVVDAEYAHAGANKRCRRSPRIQRRLHLLQLGTDQPELRAQRKRG